jgi:Tfp pilus assembly protein PilO
MRLPFWNKLNSKNRNITVTLTVLILNAAVIYFFILPTINKIKSLRNEILNIEIDSANKITQEKNISDLNNKIKKIQPQLNEINSIFINQNREIEFINALEDLASKNNIDQKLNIDFNNPTKGGTFNSVPVGINANGNFNNVIGYLSALEAMSYYINIDSVTFTASNNSKDTGDDSRPFESKNGTTIDLNLVGHSFWK